LNQIREEAKDWFDGALIDLDEARSALVNNRFNWVLFAAHQAVEKALKAALMVLKKARPPRTHDLVRLLNELGLELPSELRQVFQNFRPMQLFWFSYRFIRVDIIFTTGDVGA